MGQGGSDLRDADIGVCWVSPPVASAVPRESPLDLARIWHEATGALRFPDRRATIVRGWVSRLRHAGVPRGAMKPGRAVAAAVAAVAIVAAAPAADARSTTDDPLRECVWPADGIEGVGPAYRFDFIDAPRTIVAGSGWHTFSIRFRARSAAPIAANDFRWHLDLYKGSEEVQQVRRPAATKVEYRGKEGTWRPLGPDHIKAEQGDKPGSVTVRVSVGSGAPTRDARLMVWAGFRYQDRSPRESWEEVGPCLDAASDTYRVRIESETYRFRIEPGWGIPVDKLVLGGGLALAVSTGAILLRRRRRGREDVVSRETRRQHHRS